MAEEELRFREPILDALRATDEREAAFATNGFFIGMNGIEGPWPYEPDRRPWPQRRLISEAEGRLKEVLRTQGLSAENGHDALAVLEEQLETQELRRLALAQVRTFIERRAISWGYVDLLLAEKLVTENSAPTLFLALITLGNTHRGYGLERENHHSGYHYHYSDARKRRSDVIFTFGASPVDPSYPITWERHGEGHAHFSPNVDMWGLKKCESVNMVCVKNGAKLGRAAFMTPSKEAKFLLP